MHQIEMVTKENFSLSQKMGTSEDILHLKKTFDKQTEIQKLLETNLQTLENRCELLEL